MAQSDSKTRSRKGAIPQWEETWMRDRTKLLVRLGITIVIAIWVFLFIWVLFLADIQKSEVRPLTAGLDLTLVLAPVLAAATGVERLLETVFNTVESSWRTLVAYLGYGFRWLKSAETEVAEARQWLQSMGAIYNSSLTANNLQMSAIFVEHKKNMVQTLRDTANDTPTPELKANLEKIADQVDKLPAEMLSNMMETLMSPTNLPLPAAVRQKVEAVRTTMLSDLEKMRQDAETKTQAAQNFLQEAQARLKASEDKLNAAANSPDYRSAKGAVTIILGLMLGVIVAAVGQIQMFALLGISVVPARFDVLITGLVIGSGSYPAHSLVGILQQGKDALDGLGNFLNNRAAPSVQSVEQRVTTIQPTAPGQPPVVGQTVVQTTAAQSSEPAVGG